MTTIACDGKSMSADSRETAGDTIISDSVDKLFELPNGTIVGCAGEVSDIFKFKEWLEADDGTKPPNFKKMSALLLHADGRLQLFEDGMLMPEKAPTAIGTGFLSALTALDMGATTKKAVQMAMKRDVFSGGRVKTLTLK